MVSQHGEGGVGGALHLAAHDGVGHLRVRVGLEGGDAADDGVELLVRDHSAACGGDGEEPGEAGKEEHEDGGHPVDAVALHAARRLVRVRLGLGLGLGLGGGLGLELGLG